MLFTMFVCIFAMYFVQFLFDGMKGKFQESDGLQFRIEITLSKMKFTIKRKQCLAIYV